jgi:hypothetical protein
MKMRYIEALKSQGEFEKNKNYVKNMEGKMSKKIVSIATVIAFAIFTWSCTVKSIQPVKLETAQKKGLEKLDIKGVIKKTGEKIQFSKKSPVRVTDDTIAGEPVIPKGDTKIVSIPLSEVSVLLVKKVDKGKSFVASLGIVAGVIGVVIIIGLILYSPGDTFSGHW